MSKHSLSDIRVIDLSQGVAGPYCTKLLADYGAEVIKVEPPEGGDISLSLGPFPGDIPYQEKSGLFLHLNGNKKSLTLDISKAGGRIMLKKLLTKADVLVESYPPGYLAGLSLSYDDLKGEVPSVIYASIIPFGQQAPIEIARAAALPAWRCPA